ncbi:hypothetical protein HBB16_19240 [Pseudonocardia sp. MCCB 268]|nr:hypothetical protein [Pseudonocardia cytotoxica]
MKPWPSPRAPDGHRAHLLRPREVSWRSPRGGRPMRSRSRRRDRLGSTPFTQEQPGRRDAIILLPTSRCGIKERFAQSADRHRAGQEGHRRRARPDRAGRREGGRARSRGTPAAATAALAAADDEADARPAAGPGFARCAGGHDGRLLRHPVHRRGRLLIALASRSGYQISDAPDISIGDDNVASINFDPLAGVGPRCRSRSATWPLGHPGANGFIAYAIADRRRRWCPGSSAA